MPPLTPDVKIPARVIIRAPTMPPLAPPAMGDPTSFAERVQAWYEAWRAQMLAAPIAATDQTEQPEPVTDADKHVDTIIEDIAAKRIKAHDPNATRLRGALDKAEAPLTGRAAQDAGLGNAIGRKTNAPFLFTWPQD